LRNKSSKSVLQYHNVCATKVNAPCLGGPKRIPDAQPIG
jgi:hypothetical protein